MALQLYNGRLSAKQEALSTSTGGRAPGPEEASVDWKKAVFLDGWHRFLARDDKRRATDPSFDPKDRDLASVKKFEDDEITINYYKILGVDTFATQADISAAFRKLSLACHPDKLSDLDAGEKETYVAAFEHIRKAYDTLKDNAKRRQYDYQRDMAQAAGSMEGWNVDWSTSFDVANVFQRLLARLKPKGTTLDVAVRCRLEKFVHGGVKVVEQEHTRIHVSVRQTYFVEVNRGASEGFSCKFREAGDWHAEARPDSINFVVTSKRHGTVLRSEDDLVLREAVAVDPFARSFSFQTDTVRGRHALVWGSNPLAGVAGGRPRTCSICLQGAGVTPSGSVRFTCLSKHAEASLPAGWEQAWNQELQHMSYYCEYTGRMTFQMPCEDPEEQGGASASEQPALARRARAEWYDDSVLMVPIHGPIAVQTRPPCTLTFYAASRHPEGSASQQPRHPPSLLAAVISSPSCSQSRKEAAWRALKAQLAPILPFWGALLAAARGIVPRPITAEPRPATAAGVVWKRRNRWSCSARGNLPGTCPVRQIPLTRLGDEALQRGDHFQAARYYASHLDESIGTDYDDTSVLALCSMSECLCRMEPVMGSEVLSDAYAHAQTAVALRPRWARAWVCAAGAAALLGKDSVEVALHAYRRAIEVEATREHVDLLMAYVQKVQKVSPMQAEALHASGNDELRRASPASAIASYTHALALLPPDPRNSQAPDDYASWRAVLHANRSAAFCQLRRWEGAVADARAAVEMQQDSVKARMRLGTALLGSALYEEAYAQFVQVEQLLQHGAPERLSLARRGTDACLSMLALWKSQKAQRRLAERFVMDLSRPPGSCKVYALGNIQFDNKEIEKWAHKLDDSKFKEDVLIVAGNACATKVGLRRTFKTLLRKFRRVFWVPGPREMRIYPSEAKSFPDSLSKLLGILDLCDELGVDVFPAAVCSGVFVVPLFSWDATAEDVDLHSKWPMDPRTELWKYMLRLNEKIVERTYDGFVITASHFPPRLGLAQPCAAAQGTAPVCEELDAQVRAVHSRVHLFASYGQGSCKYVDGVIYMSSCFGREPRRLVICSNGHVRGAGGLVPSAQPPQPAQASGPPSEAGSCGEGVDQRAAAGCPQEEGHWWVEKDADGRARWKLARWKVRDPLQAPARDIMSLASLSDIDLEGPFYLVGDWDNWEDFVPFSLQQQCGSSRVYTARRYFGCWPEEDMEKCFYPWRLSDTYVDIRGPKRKPADCWTVTLKPFHWLEVRWEVIQDSHFCERNISWRVGRSITPGPGFVHRLAEAWDTTPSAKFIGWDSVLSTLCIEYQPGQILSEEAWRAGGEEAFVALSACLEDYPCEPFAQGICWAMCCSERARLEPFSPVVRLPPLVRSGSSST